MTMVLCVLFAMFAIHGVLHNAVDAERVSRSTGSRMNGGDAVRADNTFRVNIEFAGSHMCSGVILSETRVLTSAFCSSPFGTPGFPFEVAAGVYDYNSNDESQQRRVITGAVRHESFTPATVENDIAILEISTGFIFDEYVQPAVLPARKGRGTCYASGFNTTGESDVLQELETRVIGRKKCRKSARKVGYGDRIHSTVLCTYVEGGIPCDGDDGGPLLCYDKKNDRYALAGILSWGIGRATCDVGEFVYTAVHSYLDWIAANM